MSSNLTVYRQLTTAPADMFNVLRRELGIKTSCMPFAVKAITALQSLGKLTESEALNAANIFLANLQTLNQGGITAEDYDKIDFVKRGKTITLSARVEAFLRAAARKGYRITETIIPVPKEDEDTTFFKEHFHDGEIVYILEDQRHQGDRKITAERIISSYFSKFICRLEVTETRSNKRVAMSVCEMPNDEIIAISNVSEQGFYKSRWESFTNERGYKRNRKVITDELNSGSFWTLWTGEMIYKTVLRRALKRIREVLPELKDTIYAFDNFEDNAADIQPKEIPFEIPIDVVNVDLENLTTEQKTDVNETLDLFMVNPKLAKDKANEVKAAFDSGQDLQSVINTHYASIVNIKKSKKLYPLIKPYLEKEVKDEQD
ncbi:MAG TPA: hypothetical protein VFD25_05420 [Clostridia bacterium]|nr:hypothetical protein [Clostridia bacterium]